jgi:hypothetical protein
MALPSITDLKMWVGTLFTKDDWDYNFSQIVSWLADGTSDIVVNSIKSENGLDLDGSQISNLGAATSGSQAVTLDQATTLLNRSSYYYPFSVASGKVDNDGNAAYLQKDSDTQVTVLAGNVNPDLVCIQSDGTIESVTSNTVLTVPVTDGTYHIVKEKGEAITLTTGSANKVTIGKKFPTSQNTGDYFLDNSVTPFKGYKYGVSGWDETEFCYIGDVSVSSGTATVTTFNYNNNNYNVILSEYYNNGSSWYRVYSDGWCEQGGIVDNGTPNGAYYKDLTFLKQFVDTDYFTSATPISTTTASTTACIVDKTTTGMRVYVNRTYGSDAYSQYCSWMVAGYIN